MKRIWRSSGPAAAVAAFAVAAWGADIRIVLPHEAKREVWIEQGKPEDLPRNGQEFTAKEFPVSVPSGKESGVVVLYEPETGNVALRSLPTIKGVWKVAPSEWRIARVEVLVQHAGKPMAAGLVELKSGSYRRDRLIAKRAARFFAVPPGDVAVTVRYMSGGKERRATVQKFELALKRDQKTPSLAVMVAGPVDGMEDGTTGAAAEATRDSAPSGSPIATLIVWLVALGAGAAALWFMFQFVRKNETAFALRLRNIGVHVPEGADADGAQDEAVLAPQPLVPEGHCQYCGQAFAQDGSCGCRLPGAAAPTQGSAGAFSATPAPNPRLVGGEGLTIDIPDGVSVLGREAGTAQLILPDPTVSRRHAEIRRKDGSVLVADAGSSNGTFVNGVKIEDETELKPGDTVQFGAAKLRFEA